MFRAAYRSSSGALTVCAASGLHTHVVTGRSQVWVGTEFPLRLDYGRSPHAYVNQRLQIQLQLLMMSGMPLETCWAFNERWNNKFYYKVAYSWLFLLSHTTMHGSMNVKCKLIFRHKLEDSALLVYNVTRFFYVFCTAAYQKDAICMLPSRTVCSMYISTDRVWTSNTFGRVA
jgi:hypothetical protein